MGTEITREAPPARTRGGGTRWARSLGLWLLGYALWLANAVLAILVVPLTRTLLVRLTVTFRWGPGVLGAADKFGLLLVVLAWLAWVVYVEARYRRALRQGSGALLRAAARTWLAVLAVLAVLAGAIWLLRP